MNTNTTGVAAEEEHVHTEFPGFTSQFSSAWSLITGKAISNCALANFVGGLRPHVCLPVSLLFSSISVSFSAPVSPFAPSHFASRVYQGLRSPGTPQQTTKLLEVKLGFDNTPDGSESNFINNLNIKM